MINRSMPAAKPTAGVGFPPFQLTHHIDHLLKQHLGAQDIRSNFKSGSCNSLDHVQDGYLYGISFFFKYFRNSLKCSSSASE